MRMECSVSWIRYGDVPFGRIVLNLPEDGCAVNTAGEQDWQNQSRHPLPGCKNSKRAGAYPVNRLIQVVFGRKADWMAESHSDFRFAPRFCSCGESPPPGRE